LPLNSSVDTPPISITANMASRSSPHARCNQTNSAEVVDPALEHLVGG
jgi:hypothetical protein